MEPGTRFQPVLADPIADEKKAKRVVILAGKIYYDLIKERESRGLVDDVAFVRLEELSPFPFKELHRILRRYKAAKEFFYLQEEPKNQGAFGHAGGRIDVVLSALGHGAVEYRGRVESALPAPGIGKLYAAQQRVVIDAAFAGL